jgi:putative ABC transport system permease protein
MRTLLQDLRYGLRTLAKNPGFTTVAIVTLALGIGANTAIFSVVNAVLLRPLGYPEPDRIVQFIVRNQDNNTITFTTIGSLMIWREHARILQDLAVYEDVSKGAINLTGVDRPEQVRGIRVSADYFRLFGAPVEIGRTFTAQEDIPGGPRLVVIGNGLWHRRLGADRSLLGRAILLGGEPHVVIGVLGPGFRTDPPADVWLPLQADPNSPIDACCFRGAARLKPGVTLGMAEAETKLADAEYHRKFPRTTLQAGSATVEPLRDVVVGEVRLALLVLLGAVSFVLLIASANVANLLLARATGRRREMAIRAALGAGRRRIVSQLLIEGLLLSLAGGALGLVFGYAGVRALLVIEPGDIPRIGALGSAVTLDWRVLFFTLLISVLIGVVFGLLPAFTASREDVSAALKESGNRSGSSLGQSKARSILVITEVALSLVLLTGAALLTRTFVALRTIDPGFDSHNVLTMEMSLNEPRFAKTAAVAQLVRDAERRVESLPGVTVLATTTGLPLEPKFWQPFNIEGRPLAKDRYHGIAEIHGVSPGYFEVFRIRLVRGRSFTDHDDGRASGVALISESMAKGFWQKGNPVGEHIALAHFKGRSVQIIGVVADVRDTKLSEDPVPIIYVPPAQLSDADNAGINAREPITWVVRTKVEPYSLRADIERELRIASGGLPVAHIRSMDQVRLESTARTNFNMALLNIFAGLAVLLAAIGIYGVMSYAIGQRVHEIGIRVALGARAGDVLSLVLRQGLSLALVGIAIGLFGAMWLTEAMKSLLFGVSTNDPATFAMVGALLLFVAAVATYIPARRATKVDPMVALRHE